MSTFQFSLPLVQYEFEKEIIHQRVKDGYVNATAMCKAAGKQLKHYNENQNAKEFAAALSRSVGIPTDLLIQVISTGANDFRGTWVHPQVAINLAQWLSADFAVKVTQWVMDWFSGNIPGGRLPYHLRRYVANMSNVPAGHFSMLNEITIALIAPLERMGYILPASMLPDGSEGKIFCRWLREQGIEVEAMPSYRHEYEDGRVVWAKAYPNTILHLFRRHFTEVWLHQKAIAYFGERDQNAVPYITKLLALPNYRDIAGFVTAA